MMSQQFCAVVVQCGVEAGINYLLRVSMLNLHLRTAIIHCVLPIVLGGLLYILFRSTHLRMFEWVSEFGFDNIIFSVRGSIGEFKNSVPKWIYFSLPDGLWVYSFTSALLIIWRKNRRQARLWILVPFTLGVIIEILQLFHLFPGTFDILDLIFSITFFALSVQVFRSKKTI